MTQQLAQLITKSLELVQHGRAEEAPPVSSVITPSTASAPNLALREKIFALQDALQGAIERGELREQVHELPLRHSFIPGGYARELTIPAGAVIVGKIHRYPCFNFVAQGRISVLSEYGTKEIVAPAWFASPAGVKRVGYAHETTVWVTFHPTDCTDLDKIEDELTVPGYEAFDPAADVFVIEEPCS